MYHSPIPPGQEGRFAVVTNVGRDAMDVSGALTNAAGTDGEGVWSRFPDAGIKPVDLLYGRRWLKSPDTEESAL